jgi:glycine C-acetyltransferase
LRKRLEKKYVPGMRIIVLTDSVFSMDGNIAPLPELLEVLKDYPDSTLVLDEAHATGTIGATGKGIFEHFNMTPQDAINMGVNPVIITTFSKFAGSAGTAVSSDVPEIINLMKFTPTSIATIAMAPSLVAGALTSLKLLQEQPHIVARLHENTKYFRQKLKENHFEILESTTPVIPVITNELHPRSFAHRLLEQYKIWTSAVWYIARPRLRIIINALHTKEQMDYMIDSMIKVRQQLIAENDAEKHRLEEEHCEMGL